MFAMLLCILVCVITPTALSQTFHEVETRVVDSTIAFRARITDSSGQVPQPFPDLSNFTIQTGPVARILKVQNTAPREGSVWLEGQSHVDYYRKYIDVLADVSASTLEEIQQVLTTFIHSLFDSSETTYITLKLFAGGETPLLLTSSAFKCASCVNGYSNDKEELLNIIAEHIHHEWLYKNWPEFDVKSSSVYQHLTREAASLNLRLQARESKVVKASGNVKSSSRRLRTSTAGLNRPIATTHHLVVVTDLDNSAETGTLESTLNMVDLAQHHTPGAITLVLIEAKKDSGMQVYDRAVAAGVAFAQVATVIHANNSKEMKTAFLKISTETSQKLNSFVEFKICTPERSGTHDLTVTYHGEAAQQSNGSSHALNTVTTRYSAKDFHENKCGADSSLIYSKETAFCDSDDRCGYVGHTICPPCKLPTSHKPSKFSFAQPFFSPVFDLEACGKPGQRVYEITTNDHMKYEHKQDKTWEEWGSDLIVSAFVERDHHLIRLGETFHGIQIQEVLGTGTPNVEDTHEYKILVTLNETADNAQLRVMPGSPQSLGSTGEITVRCIEGCDCDGVWYVHDYVLFFLGLVFICACGCGYAVHVHVRKNNTVQ